MTTFFKSHCNKHFPTKQKNHYHQIHVYHHLVDQTLFVKFQTTLQSVNVFLDSKVLPVHQDVDRNVLSVLIVLVTKLVWTINVLIHVLESVVIELNVKSSTIVLYVAALNLLLVILSLNARTYHVSTHSCYYKF